MINKIIEPVLPSLHTIFRCVVVLPLIIASIVAAAPDDAAASGVKVDSFAAKKVDGQAQLAWTAGKNSNVAFEVFKRTKGASEWTSSGFVTAKEVVEGVKHYEFADTDVRRGVYEYRLKVLAMDGSFKYSQAVEVKILPPKSFKLEQNYPNPFNPATFIRYELAETSFVQLVIYNTLGETVRTLVKEERSAGNYAIRWDGKNDDGIQVVSGTYFYTLKIYGEPAVSKQMLMVK